MTRAVTRLSVAPTTGEELVERIEQAIAVASGAPDREPSLGLHGTVPPAVLETVHGSHDQMDEEPNLAFPVGEFEVTVWLGAAERVQVAVEETQQDDPEAVPDADARSRPISD